MEKCNTSPHLGTTDPQHSLADFLLMDALRSLYLHLALQLLHPHVSCQLFHGGKPPRMFPGLRLLLWLMGLFALVVLGMDPRHQRCLGKCSAIRSSPHLFPLFWSQVEFLS